MKTVDRLAVDQLLGLDEYLARAEEVQDRRFRAFLMFMYMRCVLVASDGSFKHSIDMNVIFSLSKQLYSDCDSLQGVLSGEDLSLDW